MTDTPKPDTDRMLQILVGVASKYDLQFSISVFVGGSWISGTVISPRMFTVELAEQIRRVAGDRGQPIETFFSFVGSRLFPSESEAEADEELALQREELEKEWSLPLHLHLRNARLVAVGGSIPSEGTYMRIRLTEVAGWTVGEYTPAAGPTPGD